MRAQTGEFIAEGPQAVREALVVPGVVLEVFATARYEHWRVDGVLWSQVSDDELAEIADAVTPQGIVARCASVLQPLSTLQADLQLVAVGVGVRDPGNAGSLVRAADAAGADAVVFAGDTVDPLNPKAVRATVGSLFHLPVVVEPDVATVLEAMRQRGIRMLAADGGGERSLFQLELDGRTAWLFGNEAHGMSADVLQEADERVAIPIYGRAESLNLATAAAVCLYASARAQRRPTVIE
ncbi:MAG TPA: RNA methyltransferase [Aeromicrobium sp.]|nr:RNA methyltransferase [Aeromicrobium sp.]